jgi:hypothetical protein
MLANRSRTGLAPNPITGIQKTFSAGPCSFSAKEFWFPGTLARPRSNPFLTHDTVESPANFSAPLSKEQRAAASNQPRGIKVQPLRWLTAALNN